VAVSCGHDGCCTPCCTATSLEDRICGWVPASVHRRGVISRSSPVVTSKTNPRYAWLISTPTAHRTNASPIRVFFPLRLEACRWCSRAPSKAPQSRKAPATTRLITCMGTHSILHRGLRRSRYRPVPSRTRFPPRPTAHPSSHPVRRRPTHRGAGVVHGVQVERATVRTTWTPWAASARLCLGRWRTNESSPRTPLRTRGRIRRPLHPGAGRSPTRRHRLDRWPLSTVIDSWPPALSTCGRASAAAAPSGAQPGLEPVEKFVTQSETWACWVSARECLSGLASARNSSRSSKNISMAGLPDCSASRSISTAQPRGE
jgi:hypothetical protein